MAGIDHPDFAVLKQHSEAIAASDRVIAEQTLRKGRHLILALTKLADTAAFDRWLETIAMAPATAALLERAAQLFNFEHADQIQAGAMLLLAGPEVSANAIADAKQFVRSGRRQLTYAQARALVDRYAPATKGST